MITKYHGYEIMFFITLCFFSQNKHLQNHRTGNLKKKLTLCTALRDRCQATDLWIDASHSAQTMYKDFAGHFFQPNNGRNVAQMRRNRPIGKLTKKSRSTLFDTHLTSDMFR